MSAIGIQIDADLRTRFYQAALLSIGGLLFGIARLIAGWLVGMFSATLALPANTQLAVTTLVFLGLVYAVALHTEPEDDETVLDKLTGGTA